MADKLQYWMFRLRSSLKWYGQAVSRYDVHAPFLADFIEQVIMDKRPFHVFDLVSQVRAYWAKHEGKVNTLEQGAPSKVNARKIRPTSELVKGSAIPESAGALLFRLALWQQPKTIVELGTNAGISTLYLHFADRRAKIHTIEGNPEVAGMAKRTFEIARCHNSLRQYVGTFKEVLPPLLQQLDQVDLLFIDGDHRYEATMDYVRQVLPKMTENSVIVVADIHWSEGMERAWAALKELSEVTASLDTYHFGILFFRKGLTPDQHLALVNERWKPWRMGFFAR